MTVRLRKSVEEVWKQLRKGIGQLLSANVLNKIIQMLSNMVITRLLSKPEYGLWSYVLNIYSYLSLISGFGLLSGAFQFGAENRNSEKEFGYYRYCLKTGVLIDLALIGCFLIGTCCAELALEEAKKYICIYIPIVLMQYVLDIFLTILRSENRISEYARVLNIHTTFTALGTCVGAAWGIWGVIVGKYIAVLISNFYMIKKIQPEIKKIRGSAILNRNQIKKLWHFSLIVGACSTMNQLLYLVDVSMIAEFVNNPVDVANYKVATLIPTALGFIPSSVVVAVVPNIIHNKNNKEWLKRHIKKLYLYMSLLNIVLCAGLVVCAPYIIRIISGKQYLSAVPIFRILTVEYFFNGTLRSLSINMLASLRFVHFEFLSSVITVVCDMGLNYVLIGKYGTIGAAYATLAAMAIAGVLSFSFLYIKIWSMKPIRK